MSTLDKERFSKNNFKLSYGEIKLAKIVDIGNILINDEKLDIETVALTSVALFFTFSTIYSIFVFTQFNVSQILSVSAVFFGLIIFLVSIFLPLLFKSAKHINIESIAWATVVAGFMLALLNSPSTQFLHYFKTYPLLEAELGTGWHQDSAFHASIINSIINFGFPSIGQHDSPILFYHVLSHYVDSIIINITGIDVWQSYGLLYFYKSILLIVSILFFITAVTRTQKYYVFLISIVFLIPVAIGRWHAIGSHGLWFTSLIIIFSAYYVFTLISKKRTTHTLDYLALFLLAVIISLGKVSSGFMFSVFVGFSLLLIYYKDWRLYFWGISLLIFFAAYHSVIAADASSTAFLFPDIDQFIVLLNPYSTIGRDKFGEIYSIFIVITITAWFFHSRLSLRFVVAGLLSILTMAVIVALQPGFSASDKWYFFYGLMSLMILLGYQVLMHDFSRLRSRNFESLIYFNHRYIKAYLAIFVLAGSSLLNSTEYNLFNAGLNSTKKIFKNFYSQPFVGINRYDSALQANITKMVKNRDHVDFDSYDRPLKDFNDALKSFMTNHDLTSKNTLLFIPMEVFKNEVVRFKGNEWARGMLVYAVTGVPLVHGIATISRRYGYADYDSNATWVPMNELDIQSVCEFQKTIIVVESLLEKKFNLVECV